MACFKPLQAYRAPGGVAFDSKSGYADRPLELPCGQCIGCRLDKARDWAVRITHEAMSHRTAYFVTLTYAIEPEGSSLNVRDWQLFSKRLRKRLGPFRFFHVGEYGDERGRPHHHAALFGIEFPDKVQVRTTSRTKFKSQILDELWGHGLTEIEPLVPSLAAYLARYVIKKINGEPAGDHYQGRKPEYATMSLKPGIGIPFYEAHRKQFARDGYCIFKGNPVPLPKAYRIRMEDDDQAAYQAHRAERIKAANTPKAKANNTRERLEVRETVKRLKQASLKRDLESGSPPKTPFPLAPRMDRNVVSLNSLPKIITTNPLTQNPSILGRAPLYSSASRPKATSRSRTTTSRRKATKPLNSSSADLDAVGTAAAKSQTASRGSARTPPEASTAPAHISE